MADKSKRQFAPSCRHKFVWYFAIMLWWEWNGKQKLALLAAMLIAAALPWIFLGWLPQQLGAFVGGTSFLFIPQIVGWQLFVGLKTGIMPQRGARVSRADSPTNFWITGGMYSALLVLYVGIILMVLLDVAKALL
ncbi:MULTISPECIES: hypothetical protein [unclassified Novosphingobium]|uniref:hypothetical protein n=1 Tax=unclassified Novosphingobium TaxID=2644732 RepID=UPI001495060A|nr:MULTISPECIES: hypothetical protein [unclassified Novosphingobium]MBB3650655.1 hypothetical protein [Novosphingobium sp. BK626]MBB3356878.1 hypothetical protein [Novosphingobium sp. BK256]MBB3373279.1 hypothetical protein [Novosphingobium sp. BK280]MBB3377648.1 hypothetical protein [Novosphingobium sp. BK258]MBB3418941.1 hypothetical protein [Novosphingobium sp. BK267]